MSSTIRDRRDDSKRGKEMDLSQQNIIPSWIIKFAFELKTVRESINGPLELKEETQFRLSKNHKEAKNEKS